MVVEKKKSFGVQPSMLKQLQKGIVIGESILMPKGTPFGALCFQTFLMLDSFEEGGQVVSIGGVQVSTVGAELRVTHMKEEKKSRMDCTYNNKLIVKSHRKL